MRLSSNPGWPTSSHSPSATASQVCGPCSNGYHASRDASEATEAGRCPLRMLAAFRGPIHRAAGDLPTRCLPYAALRGRCLTVPRALMSLATDHPRNAMSVPGHGRRNRNPGKCDISLRFEHHLGAVCSERAVAEGKWPAATSCHAISSSSRWGQHGNPGCVDHGTLHRMASR
ncbi:hypothetical protein BU16DRAFT_525150 [Lophium mytilinum]|uniref:Uncharacterized protein n=1 Tax=Lophium mytilinum TaxID=390894 RepID=A0A6A6QZG1_9PEZI|nr:hypothetical protein BU16DRAFT_525150 [Lophium mytilinum]